MVIKMKRRVKSRIPYSVGEKVRRCAEVSRNLLFPPRCIGCGDLLPPFEAGNAVFCPLCRTAWETARAEVIHLHEGNGQPAVLFLVPYRSGQTDGVPERFIYHLKHGGESRAFGFAAEGLAPAVRSALGEVSGGESVLFTYPPRRRSAVREEGFDQAARLAKALAGVCGGEFAVLLRRTLRHTDEQKLLDSEERATNATRAYALKGTETPKLRGRTVVLCDDLCTTGSTLLTCARLLTHAGADRVLLVTVARTMGSTHTE